MPPFPLSRAFSVLLALAGLLVGCASPGPRTPASSSSERRPAGRPVAAEPGPAQPGGDEAATGGDLTAPLPVAPDVAHGRLDNGLAWFVRSNERPDARIELRLAVDAGSVLETPDQLGLAHFVEHMAFNGTARFAKQELVDYLESIGMRFGPDVNAYTSFDETVYMLRVPADDAEIVDRAFAILRDWAGAVSFAPEEVESERGVVIEEWRLGRGAQARLRDQHYPVLFRDSLYAERLPIGEPEVLRNAPPGELVRFYETWYRPELMAVVAVGDLPADELAGKIRAAFADLPAGAGEAERPVPPVPDHEGLRVSVATDPEATLTTVSLYSKLPPSGEGTVGDYRRSLAESLYHEMFDARLDELARGEDPPFLFAASGSGAIVRPRDVYVLQAGVREGSVERALAALLEEAERVERHGFLPGELERAKAELLRFYESAYEERDKLDSGDLADELVRHFLEEEPVPGIAAELELVRRLLPGIGLAEIGELAGRWLEGGGQALLVSAPESEAEAIPAPEALRALAEQIEQSPVEPWVDRVREAPLVEETPAPGELVEESEVEEIGLLDWRFANGVRLLLMPTDFQNDEVLLRAYSPGGHSLVAVEDLPSARFAATVASLGGLGAFDRTELDKALAGRVVGVQPYIGELEEGLTGGASPADLETLFQLVHLHFTAPRFDEAAFTSFVTRMRGFVENRRARPEAVFQDRMTEELSRGHPRRRPVDVETVDAIDLATAERIYRDRFADAGDFTFVLVGAFDPEAVRPLARTWLASLPATGRDESWRDPGVEPPAGGNRFTVARGVEPKARVNLVTYGEGEWSREEQHAVTSLVDALRIRLREVLREDLGATYGVAVSGSLSRRPDERYRIALGFGCDPAEAERLIDTLLAELESVRRQGFAMEVIEKVRETQRRERETDLEENEFWADALESHATFGMDPRLILRHDELVEALDAELLRRTAERYLGLEDHVLGVLVPEEDPAAP